MVDIVETLDAEAGSGTGYAIGHSDRFLGQIGVANDRDWLRADLEGAEITLAPMERRLIPTGLRMQIPPGFEVQVRARSGAALRDGLSLVNGVGTIDADYRGPVGVIVINLSDVPLVIRHGDRIAQIVVAPVVQAIFTPAQSVNETARGSGGFGSTGRG